jgi:hypothetical protein
MLIPPLSPRRCTNGNTPRPRRRRVSHETLPDPSGHSWRRGVHQDPQDLGKKFSPLPTTSKKKTKGWMWMRNEASSLQSLKRPPTTKLYAVLDA